jgi:hypothetical protein
MHGIVFLELEKFATHKLGAEAWPRVVEAAKMESRIFIPVSTYPDEEFAAVVAALAVELQQPVRSLLEAFGTFIAPHLLQTYQFLVRPEWKALDLLEHTESVMHTVVRRRSPNAAPPRLGIARISPEQVLIVYASPRKLCDLARGIVRGLAWHYKEGVLITEESCMHQRASACRIRVTAQ